MDLVKSGYAGSTTAGSERILDIIEQLSDNELVVAKSSTNPFAANMFS